jgi:GNAT superfamily N-acetyltransferase
VTQDPGLLGEQLCRLLDAAPDDGLPGRDTLVLDDGYAPSLRLSRRVPFTDTEVARAAQMCRLAATVAGTGPDPAAVPRGPLAPEPARGEVALRQGTTQDVQALVAMHARCSARTVQRRYHVPMPRLGPRPARRLLAPEGGFSIVLTVDDEIAAIGMLSPDTSGAADSGAEVGLMVEDRWQGRGYGTKVLRALAVEAAGQGFYTLTCWVQPDNDAVPATIRAAGLRALVGSVDGLLEYRIPVRKLRGTSPLVALLHERPELREVYAPAALVDQAVRDGA